MATGICSGGILIAFPDEDFNKTSETHKIIRLGIRDNLDRDWPKSFCIGASDYDPKVVGYDTPNSGVKSCPDGVTLFQTVLATGKPIIGNSNLGHSFEDAGDKSKAGVLGRGFSDDERNDLIEYLKTL